MQGQQTLFLIYCTVYQFLLLERIAKFVSEGMSEAFLGGIMQLLG